VGKVQRILQSPVDKHLLIFLGTHGINWVGEDCGRKIKALNHGRKIKEFVFHPTQRNWGLATAFTLCEDFVGEPCKIYKELFVTRDLGENWDLIGSYITQFSWGVVDESHVKAGIPLERILVTSELRGKGDQTRTGGWNYKVDLTYSDDFFKTRKIGVHKGNKFMLTKDYLFVAQVLDQESQEVVLLVSKSNLKNYELEPIVTNQKKFKEHSYTFLDTTEGSVFLHINHFGPTSKYGHIYTSDAEGMNYSLSLKYNIRSYGNQCDFEKVNSLEGIYISNAISSSYMRSAEQEMEEEELEESESMEEENHTKEKNQEKLIQDEFRDFTKTLISFSKGGDWSRIKAPQKNSEGGAVDCGDFCFLNLHGISSNYPSFYSVPSAAGILIANGNIGRYLSHVPEETSTYLSRDGGLNWNEIRKGSHIYEIGDHGALILIADDKNPTNTIFYTWNEGSTFEQLKISDEKIFIRNIIIEPTSTSQHFIVYGETQNKKGERKGVVIGIDFTSLHEPQCRNPDNPDTAESDYEKWTPNDGRGGKECLLGRKVTYVRRKQNAECYNGLDYERKVVVENCQCTESDYECDVGYERAGPGEPCVSSTPHGSVEVHNAPAVCHGFYTISKGYRKVPGNTCVNGVKFDPILIPCPYNGIFASVSFIFFLLIIIVMVLLIVIAFSKNFFQNVSDVIRDKLKSKETAGKRKEDYVNIVNKKLNY
jgi:hypothetical protein